MGLLVALRGDEVGLYLAAHRDAHGTSLLRECPDEWREPAADLAQRQDALAGQGERGRRGLPPRGLLRGGGHDVHLTCTIRSPWREVSPRVGPIRAGAG